MYHTVICGLSGCTIFSPHYLINSTIFGGGGGILNIKCVVRFFIQMSEKFLILKVTAPYIIVNVNMPYLSTRYCSQSLMKPELFRQIL